MAIIWVLACLLLVVRIDCLRGAPGRLAKVANRLQRPTLTQQDLLAPKLAAEKGSQAGSVDANGIEGRGSRYAEDVKRTLAWVAAAAVFMITCSMSAFLRLDRPLFLFLFCFGEGFLIVSYCLALFASSINCLVGTFMTSNILSLN